MARRRVSVRKRTIAYDLNKVKHEARMAVVELGMEIIGELAEKVADEANVQSQKVRCEWETLSFQQRRRGPNKKGRIDSGPIAGSIYAMPSEKVPSSWLVVSPAWYSHFVEYGTDPHDMPRISSKKGKDMWFLGTNASAGQAIKTKKVGHPGIRRPQPFMRTAADKADAFLDEIIQRKGSV